MHINYIIDLNSEIQIKIKRS